MLYFAQRDDCEFLVCSVVEGVTPSYLVPVAYVPVYDGSGAKKTLRYLKAGVVSEEQATYPWVTKLVYALYLAIFAQTSESSAHVKNKPLIPGNKPLINALSGHSTVYASYLAIFAQASESSAQVKPSYSCSWHSKAGQTMLILIVMTRILRFQLFQVCLLQRNQLTLINQSYC